MIIGIASADYLRASKSPDGQVKWGGSGWARIGQYVPFLAMHHDVYFGTLWRHNGALAIEYDNDDGSSGFVRPDVIILQRMMMAGMPEDLREARKRGQVIINDLDDWYWGLDPRNSAWLASHPKTSPTENVQIYTQVMMESDLVVVSTPFLANKVSKSWGLDVEIVRNYVDVGRFTPVEPSTEGKPVLGWVGSTAHRSGDLREVRGVLGRLRDDFSFYHGGWSPDAPSFASEVGLGEDEVQYRGLTTYDKYPELLKMDVGIVPMRDVPFNHAKSDIKGLEYAASGIPFVASVSPSYTTLYNEFGGAFGLARKPKDWIKQLKRYTDPSAREEDRRLLLAAVETRHIDFGARHWLSVLETIEPKGPRR